MTTRVALLRGINVGGKNRVPMAELRAVFESLGCTRVRTYIQSGNVLFGAGRSVTPARVQQAIEHEFGVESTVVMRTAEEVRGVAEARPFPDADLSAIHVGFLADAPAKGVLEGFDDERFRPDELAVIGREVYLHLPNGVGRAKLPRALERHLGIPTTIRNWKTVSKLVELAGSSRD